MQTAYTIFPLGDSALTIDFGNRMDESLNEKVLQLYHRLQHFSPVIKDLLPAYSSLTIYYDVAALHTKSLSAFEAAKHLIELLIFEDNTIALPLKRQLHIPVCHACNY
ncbi:MAG TPA: carboxyltransferase domain-containing protein, partial [Flavisolibacter sp.]